MKTNVDEQTGWMDVLGPKIKRLTRTHDGQDQYSVLLGAIGPGVAVPLHSHRDRETFYILEGTVEGYLNGSWTELSACDIFDIPGNEMHAWRNVSDRLAKMLIITTDRMGDFFEEIGKPGSAEPKPPTPDEVARFMEVAGRYGYSLASPAQNDAIGIKI